MKCGMRPGVPYKLSCWKESLSVARVRLPQLQSYSKSQFLTGSYSGYVIKIWRHFEPGNPPVPPPLSGMCERTATQGGRSPSLAARVEAHPGAGKGALSQNRLGPRLPGSCPISHLSPIITPASPTEESSN